MDLPVLICSYAWYCLLEQQPQIVCLQHLTVPTDKQRFSWRPCAQETPTTNNHANNYSLTSPTGTRPTGHAIFRANVRLTLLKYA